MFSVKKWTWMTFAGWFAGICLVLVLSSTFDALGIEDWQFIIAVGMGLGVGFMQWLALRKIIPVTASWIWLTVLGLSIPFLFSDLLSHFTDYKTSEYSIFFNVVAGSVIIGLLQMRVLQKHGKNATGWVLACLIGWTLAVMAFWGINYTKQVSDNNMVLFFLNIILMLIGGPLLGYVSGRFLSKILPPHTSTSSV